MMADSRSSALSKRAEQLKRWEESDTNKQSPFPKQASRIQFSSGIVFLAACTAGDKEEVQRLLKLGADINTANVDGLTALHQACIDDNLDMVEFLVSRGADVNRGDNEGWTPLHATASCGFLSIARYLLENGADVAAVNYDGELPIDISESDQMEGLLQGAIEEQEVDCEMSRNAEINALMTDAKNWAKNGYLEVHDPKTGATPLHVAAAKGYIDVARLLLEDCHVDPDSVDYEGWTPLHAAALWGQKEASAILLKQGADPVIKNYSGQTCMDLVDPSLVSWLQEAILTCPAKLKKNINNNNNINNKPKRIQQPDVKRVELKITGQDENNVNDKPASPSEIIPKITDGKPPKGRPPSPDISTEPTDATNNEDSPSWRRSASFRTRQNENKDSKVPTQNNAVQFDNDGRIRRTHSFENDKTFYQRYRDVTARIKASSCPSIPPLPQSPHDVVELRPQQNNLERSTNNKETNEDVHFRKDRDSNTWTPPVTTAQTTVRRSFVPPVRDDESETQRKAHAKRVRETRRSTQGVTLDELKSAEQLVKKKSSNGTIETTVTPQKNEVEDNSSDHNSSFELEDAGRSASPRPATAPTPTGVADTTVTIPLRRPPSASALPTTNAIAAPTVPIKDEKVSVEVEKEPENTESKNLVINSSPASTQAALNVIQRRRRPKRRSTGVGHVDMDDIINDRGGGAEGEANTESLQSGSERTTDAETQSGEEKDYKALYEASSAEVRRLRDLLATSEQQLRDARATIVRFSQVNQLNVSEQGKREKRAMERKLSEMEEELKFHQVLQAENQRLKDENGALIRVISKLSK